MDISGLFEDGLKMGFVICTAKASPNWSKADSELFTVSLCVTLPHDLHSPGSHDDTFGAP